jgi:hypothetical protein
MQPHLRNACGWHVHSSPPACLSLRAWQVPQLVQERFGIFQICCIETLDEPPINRLQEGTGLYVSAFLVPMLCEASGGAQLPPTGLLLPRNRQCLQQSSLRLTFLA